MLALGGLVCGKRVTISGCGTLVVAAHANAERGLELLVDELAELERRKWIAFVGETDAVVTREGVKWWRIWYAAHTGRKTNWFKQPVRVNIPD